MMSCHLEKIIQSGLRDCRTEGNGPETLTTFFSCLSTSSILKFSLDIATEMSSFAGANEVFFVGRALPCCTGYVSPASTALAYSLASNSGSANTA